MRRAAILLVLVAGGCGGSEQRAAERTCPPTPGAVEAADLASSATAARVRLGPGMELKATKRNLAAARVGDPLTVTGTVRAEDCASLVERWDEPDYVSVKARDPGRPPRGVLVGADLIAV